MAESGTTSDQMTLIEHLVELRTRIFICAIAVVVAAIVVFIFFPPILTFLEEPYRDVTAGRDGCGSGGCDLIATDPLAPFLVRLKVAGYGGLALALPVVMWEIWRFVVPALNPNEKRYAIPFVVAVGRVVRAGLRDGVVHDRQGPRVPARSTRSTARSRRSSRPTST